jgi:hypothetical protein
MKHLCQGTKCHTYDTQSRVRGTKGNKVLRTRNAYTEIQPNSDWANSSRWVVYFCDERCMQDWLAKHIEHFMNIVGIKTTPQETPVDIVKTVHQNWVGHDYTRTTIKLKQNESNVLT